MHNEKKRQVSIAKLVDEYLIINGNLMTVEWFEQYELLKLWWNVRDGF